MQCHNDLTTTHTVARSARVVAMQQLCAHRAQAKAVVVVVVAAALTQCRGRGAARAAARPGITWVGEEKQHEK